MADDLPDDWRGQPDMHPWHCIAEELLARGWSKEDLAIRMAFPDYDALLVEVSKNMLVLDMYQAVGPTNPRCRIGETSGAKIDRAFGLSEGMINRLDTVWRDAALAKTGA